MFRRRRIGSFAQVRRGFGGGGAACPPGGGGGMGGMGGGGGGMGGMGGGRGPNNVQYNPIYDDLSEGTIIEQMMPVDARRLHRIWRRIYLQDPVAGSGIDLYSDMPWSDWELTGVDSHVLKVYQDCFNALNMVALMPELTREFLVMGKITLHLLLDESLGYFNFAIPCDPDYIRVVPQYVPGFHPKIDLQPSPEMRRWASSQDPRDLEAIAEVPQYAEMLRMGRDIPLPQSNTIYVPRKVSPYDVIGASIYTRIILFVAYEKHLINATISAAKRRAGRIRHLKIGLDGGEWDPQPEEIDAIADEFMGADMDPVGAIVATRTGVELNETGGSSPQDMLKVSDEWSFLCLDGSSLIPTVERGLVPIRDLADRKNGHVQDLPLTVASRWGNAPVNKWIYAGHKPTLRVTTASGNEVIGLPRHKMLVLDPTTGETEFRRVSDMTPGDLLCISTTPCVRTTKLTLGLSPAASLISMSVTGDVSKPVTQPKVMTPELAFILGLVVAEGCMNEYAVTMSNGDLSLIEKYEQCVSKVFGRECARSVIANVGDRKVINGVATQASRTCYNVALRSKVARAWLEELGVSRERSAGKVIPWSILQADGASQLSFLAAYLEGDGAVSANGNLEWASASKQLLAQIQVILNAHGVLCTRSANKVRVTGKSAHGFLAQLAPYMVTKHTRVMAVEAAETRRGARNSFGVPNTFVKDVLKARRIRQAGPNGTLWLDDAGNEIVVKLPLSSIDDEKVFAHDRHDRGDYDTLLAGLKLVSRSTHDKLVGLLKLRYRYVPITKIAAAGRRYVYDLNMKDTANRSFVSNGLISSNTEGKLGALGISPSFLNGEATFSNMETQLSVFLEKIRAHRDFLTSRVLLDICRRLAILHGFKKIKKSTLEHRYRVTAAASANDADYELPKFVFSKPLRPVADEQYLQILDTMEQKGIPVPMREWSAAGGLDLEAIIAGLDTDKQDRAIFNAFKKDVENAGMQAPGGESGGGDFGGGGFGDLGGGDFGGGGDLGGGDLGGGDLGGGDLGGGDLGADMGGGDLGGADAGGGGENITAASFRGAASLYDDFQPASIQDRPVLQQKPWEPKMHGLALWDRHGRVLGLTRAEAYRIAQRIIPGRRYSQNEFKLIARTGNARKDEVLHYVLYRSGVIETCALSEDVAHDLARWVVERKVDNRIAYLEVNTLRSVTRFAQHPTEQERTRSKMHLPQNLPYAVRVAQQRFSSNFGAKTLLTGYTEPTNPNGAWKLR